LKEKAERVIKDYEAAISKDMTQFWVACLSQLQLPSWGHKKGADGLLIGKKIAGAKKNAWKLKYDTGHEVLLRDLVGPVINIIKEAQKFVDIVVSADPYASIAWAGISLLLPVSLIIRYWITPAY
jgi:hypothetical protein